jgi:3-oxoacyl-[acyl-carrier-protein] synthase-3
MTALSLVATASYMPSRVVERSFFGSAGDDLGMFKAARLRRHAQPHESAAHMIESAARSLGERLNLDFARDVDVILTNVSIPDASFTGCGATVSRRLGCRPAWVLDLHNTGCVSFVFMLAVARSLMASGQARTALLCNVQNAGGRVFAHEQNRGRSESAVPGDGCGVGYVVANDSSPVRSIVTHCHSEHADDMQVSRDGQVPWWEPSGSPLHIDFTESRVAKIVARGNQLVPQAVRDAAREAHVSEAALDLLATNQPNAIFLRNWREALLLPEERHVDTLDEYGNLFGAAIPINLERAQQTGRLKPGSLVALAGFSHAGDYSGAAIVEWQKR